MTDILFAWWFPFALGGLLAVVGNGWWAMNNTVLVRSPTSLVTGLVFSFFIGAITYGTLIFLGTLLYGGIVV